MTEVQPNPTGEHEDAAVQVQHCIDTPMTTETKHFTRRHLVLGPIVCIYMFTYILSFTNMTLYGPYYIGKVLFPNGTSGTGGKSMCDVDIKSQAFEEFLEIQDYSSRLNIYFTLASGFPAILTNLLFGTFSDHFGRKFLFIVPMIGSIIKNAVCAVGIYYTVNFYVLLVGYIVEGITGLFLSTLLVAFAYVSDITTKDKKRSLGITAIEIAVGIGAVLGGFITGYAIRAVGYMWPLVFSVGLLVVNILLVIFVLPETVNVRSQKENRLTSSDVLQYVKTVFSFYVEPNPDGKRWRYNICIIIFTLTSFTVMGRSTVETLYQIRSPLCWDSVKIGWYSSIRSFAQNVVGMVLIKVFHICMNDEMIAVTGTITSIAGFIMEGFSKSDIYMYMVTVVGAGGVLTLPMMRAIMSRMTPEDRQGAMFGGVAAVETACSVFGSIISNTIYGKTVNIAGGFVFFVFAAFCVGALLLLIILLVIPRCRRTQKYQIQKNQDLCSNAY